MTNLLAPETSIFQKLRAYWAIRKWRNTAAGRALARHTDEYFHSETAPLRFFDEDDKVRIIGDFYQKVFALAAAPNPFLAFRELLASTVIGYASLQVLSLTQEQKAEAFYSRARYVSGELHQHIRALSEHNEELKKLVWETPDVSDSDLIAAAATRAALWAYYMNGVQQIRPEFGDDIDFERDWFRPFVVSAMIFEENTYRQAIELPSLQAPDDELLALRHSTFVSGVVAGDKNPLFTWETHYKKEHAKNI